VDLAGLGTTAVRAEGFTEPLPEPGRWFEDPGVERVTLRLAPAARWVVERYPVDEVTVEQGGAGEMLLARLPVVDDRWLGRLLVRLGPDAEVVEPVERRDAGRRAAAAVLARYRRS
jgi:proteasome accessory factor C